MSPARDLHHVRQLEISTHPTSGLELADTQTGDGLHLSPEDALHLHRVLAEDVLEPWRELGERRLLIEALHDAADVVETLITDGVEVQGIECVCWRGQHGWAVDVPHAAMPDDELTRADRVDEDVCSWLPTGLSGRVWIRSISPQWEELRPEREAAALATAIAAAMTAATAGTEPSS